MKRISAYQGCGERTFRQALLRLLEQDYGLPMSGEFTPLGSRRVLEMLAADVEELIALHYPTPDRIASGWMVLTATRASNDQDKGRPGRSAGEYELVTLAWPVVTPDDLAALRTLPTGAAKPEARKALAKQRLRRLVEWGLSHPEGPALLTQADLSLLTGLPLDRVGSYLQEVRRETGQALPTMGYHFDLGMRPTHKGEIIALYESGVDELVIARRSGHSSASVGHYIRDYERVKLLLARRVAPDDIPKLTTLAPTVVREHQSLVLHYHPELAPQAPAPTQPG